MVLTRASREAAWLLVGLLFIGCRAAETPVFVPSEAWPGHDATPPYLLNGPLWVGYDERAGAWRYVRLATESPATPASRGLDDPGDPAEWRGHTGLFSQSLSELPQGTHMNMRWNPAMPAHRYRVDDVMVRVGTGWVDKYEARLVDVSAPGPGRWIDDPDEGGPPRSGANSPGNAFGVPPTWLAVSQRAQGTSGITWFVAARAAANAGKRLIANEEWQVAASGTSRTDATGMRPNGETWEKTHDEDISAAGIVGAAGSLWEWTQAWGQYGQHYNGVPEPWLDWPGAGSFHEWDGEGHGYGDDYTINVAGRVFTREGGAHYVTGLPAALVRGGAWGDQNRAGIFALIADGAPSYYGKEVGFRCAR